MKRTKMSILFLLTILLISLFHLSVPGQHPATSAVRRASTPTSRSRVTLIRMQNEEPSRFDRFKGLTSDDERTRLDYFANELQRDPSRTGCIVVYGKRGASEAKKRAANAKAYLQARLEGKPNKVVTIDNCTRAVVEYELWIMPRENPPNICSNQRVNWP